MKLSPALFLAAVTLLGACGDDRSPPECTGTSCTCPSGEACDFTESSCGAGSCSLDCSDGNVCTGTCRESCSIDCGGMSSCSVTVGASGSVTCAEESDCDVTCTGSCSLSCSGGATCRLRCPGDASSRIVEGGGECP